MFNTKLFVAAKNAPVANNNSSILEAVTTIQNTLDINHSFSTYNPDESYFIESVKFFTEMNNDMVNNSRNFYRTICESAGADEVIHEAFSDWVGYIKKLINKIIDFIKAIFNKFIIGINMLISRDQYLKDHKKELNEYNEDDYGFNMKVFNFTIENNPCPSNSVLTGYDSIDSVINSEVRDKIKDKAENGSDILAAIKTVYDEYIDSLSNDYYDKIRGKIMYGDSSDKTIYSSEYSTELFETFRDNSSEKEEKDITKADVDDASIRFTNYEKVKKDVTKTKTDIEKKYKELEKQLEKAIKSTKNNDLYDIKFDDKELGGKDWFGDTKGADTEKAKWSTKEVADKLDLFMKAKANEVQEVSTLHSMAFTARLDALKDRFKQDKAIMYKALYRIKGNISNGKRDKFFEGE